MNSGFLMFFCDGIEHPQLIDDSYAIIIVKFKLIVSVSEILV